MKRGETVNDIFEEYLREKEPQKKEKGNGILATIKSKPIGNYIGIWLMFYINITCGLALISQEKMIYKCIGLGAMVGILATVSAVFNAGGRLGFSAWADSMKDRNTIYKIIFYCSNFTVFFIIFLNIIPFYVNTNCVYYFIFYFF